MEEENIPSVKFEAVKTSMMQDKNGTNIKLTIHPNDVPQDLHKDWVGSRYMVVMVKLNEDGTPVATGGTSINVTPVVNAVVSLQGTVQLQQAELSALRADMQSYLGPNGTLAKAVGKKTVAAINDQA